MPQIVENASELAEQFDELEVRRGCGLLRRVRRIVRVSERARCDRPVVLGIGKLDSAGEVGAGRPGLALRPQRNPQSQMISGITRVEGEGAPGMRNGLVKAPQFGQGDREVQVGVGMVWAGPDRYLEFPCRGRVSLLRQQ